MPTVSRPSSLGQHLIDNNLFPTCQNNVCEGPLTPSIFNSPSTLPGECMQGPCEYLELSVGRRGE